MNDDVILAGILSTFKLYTYPQPKDAEVVARAAIMYLKAIRKEQAKND